MQNALSKYGKFSETDYLWAFSDNKTILYDRHELGYIPASNGLSDKISKDLKKFGFKFVGTITIYFHLQACGIINDHDKNCPRRKFINSNFPTIKKRRYLEKIFVFSVINKVLLDNYLIFYKNCKQSYDLRGLLCKEKFR